MFGGFGLYGSMILEVIGVVSGVLYVVLAARLSSLCWPVSFINLTVYFYVFWTAGLYADSLLQLFYFVLTIYGWWSWTRRQPVSQGPLRVQRLRIQGGVGVLACVVASTLLLAWLLKAFTPSEVPFLDAHTTAVSLVAQALATRKILENWLLWIWANVFYCALYLYKGLYLTCGLYGFFLVLAFYGFFEWKRVWRQTV